MNSSRLYAKPPEVIQCEKKGSAKNGNRILKSFCEIYCEHRRACEEKKGIRKGPQKGHNVSVE